MTLLSITSTVLFLDEVSSWSRMKRAFLISVLQSLPHKVKAKESLEDSSSAQSYASTDVGSTKSDDQPPPTVSQLLSDPFVRRLVLASFAMAGLGLGFDALFVLFAYTPIGLGGLGRQVCPGFFFPCKSTAWNT